MALPPKSPGRSGAHPKLGEPLSVEDSIAARRANDILADDCTTTEEELEALKARYEQFFLGIERREPARERTEMRRRVEKLKESFTKNTGLRFRLQTLHARFLSYERLWLRSAREKEAGTYRRDIFKARLRARGGEAAGEGKKPQEPAAASRDQAEPPQIPAAPPVAAVPPPTPGIGEAQLRALYAAFVDAKKRCNEDVSRLSFEALAKSVQKQVPDLMARFKAKAVDFRVEVKDGKAVLKAIPRV